MFKLGTTFYITDINNNHADYQKEKYNKCEIIKIGNKYIHFKKQFSYCIYKMNKTTFKIEDGGYNHQTFVCMTEEELNKILNDCKWLYENKSDINYFISKCKDVEMLKKIQKIIKGE